MYGACHLPCFGYFHEKLWCKRTHKVFGSPWVWSAIWREWKHIQWEEPKTSERGQCWNQQGVCHETRFSKANWISTYFKIYWPSWNWPWYSSECSLHWLHWHLAVKRSLLTVTLPKYESHYRQWWMWRHSGIRHWSWLSKPTDLENSLESCSSIPNGVITGHSSKHGTTGPSSSMSWRFTAIPILDPVDVETAHSDSTSHYHCDQWHVRSYGLCYASFS